MNFEIHTEPKVRECGAVVYLRTTRFTKCSDAMAYIVSLGDRPKMVTVNKKP